MEKQRLLVDTQSLASELADPALRLLDATAFLDLHPDKKSGYVPRNGRPEWEREHLAGATYIDLLTEFSDAHSRLPFTMLEPSAFCQKMGRLGVGDSHRVVIYSSGSPMWATRLWWMFRSVGFERCAVLDGGLAKWKVEQRPTTAAQTTFAPTTLTPRPTATARWATKAELVDFLQAAGDRCVIDALSPRDYSGEHAKYGGKGHIPGSHNVHYHLLLRDDGTFQTPDELRTLFARSQALQSERAICYCGGGIASTLNAMALSLCGHPNVAVYDGSMLEWASDRSLPLSVGNTP